MKENDLYFEDETATLWICESSKTKRRPFRVRREKGTKKKDEEEAVATTDTFEP